MTSDQDKVDQLARERYPDLFDDDDGAGYGEYSRQWANAIETGAPVAVPDPTRDVPGESAEAKNERLQRAVDFLKDRIETVTQSLLPRAPLLARNPVDEQHGPSCGYPHPQVLVSMTSASVKCRACGAELEPMDVLRMYARGERQFVSSIDHLRDERKKLTQEVNDLKDQRNSLRSQVRKKGGDPDQHAQHAQRARARSR